MIRPVRLQLSRRNGFDLQAVSRAANGLDAINVARPTRWGNPFNLKRSEYCWTAIAYGFKGDRLGRQATSVLMFKEWLAGIADGATECGLYADVDGVSKPIAVSPTAVATKPPPSLDDIRAQLRGKNLAYWCKPGEPCHADVLLDLANAEEGEE